MRPDAPLGESSAAVARRIKAARRIQLGRAGVCNADLGGIALKNAFVAEDRCWQLLERAMDTLSLSARAYHRVQRVARTIADMADSHVISAAHIGEALSLRQFDRDAAV
jgi:magnesium chelatase family protein